jgi:TniQ
MIEEVEAVFRTWKESPDSTKSRPWPFRPQPRPDELLSSWFLRAAHGLKLKPYTLAHMTWRSTPPLLTRDIDNLADPRVVGGMSAKADTPVQRAWETTLAAFDGLLVDNYAPGGRNSWILQLGVRHRIRALAGLQYCPICLGEAAYFKRAWRLGFVTSCPAHGVKLLDRCTNCGATVEPHRSPALWICARCGADLRGGQASKASRRVVELQMRATAVLTRGWGHLGEAIFSWSHLYFATLRIIAKALAHGPRADAFRRAVVRRFGGDPSPYPWSSGRSLEHFGVDDRHRLMDLLAPLLKEWPFRLVETCRESRMWRSWLVHDDLCPPYAIASIVDEHLTVGFYKPSELEIRAAISYLRRQDGTVTKAKLIRLIGECEASAALLQSEASLNGRPDS